MMVFQQLRKVSYGRWFVLALGAAVVFGAAMSAQATPISFSGSYDGSYDPYTASPPAGQSTWYRKATIQPVHNSDDGTYSPGVATFKDDNGPTGTRVSMDRNYSDPGGNTFSANQANDEYVYEARIKFYSAGADSSYNSYSYSVANVGFRDEYNGSTSGKCVMLGWVPSDSPHVGLHFVSIGTGVGGADSTKIVSTNYFDNAFHTYRVEKYIDGEGITQVNVRVDNTLLGTYAYSSMDDSAYDAAGFGWHGNTHNKSNATVDYINYQGFVIPEPSALVLLACGMIGLLCYAWRKRK